MKDKMKVLIVRPGKVPEIEEIEGGYKSMQKIVGGIIQAIYPWDDPVALVCDDEGKLKGYPPNRMLDGYDIIAGTFLICGIGEEDFISLNDELLKKYADKFRFPEIFIPTIDGTLAVFKAIVDYADK